MKLFTTPAIKADTDYYQALVQGALPRAQRQNGYTHRYWFCGDGVRRVFGLPQNITKVWFEFYDRAGVDRWPIEVVDDIDGFKSDVHIKINGGKYCMAGPTARYLIRRLGCTKCFVACYYEEGPPCPAESYTR